MSPEDDRATVTVSMHRNRWSSAAWFSSHVSGQTNRHTQHNSSHLYRGRSNHIWPCIVFADTWKLFPFTSLVKKAELSGWNKEIVELILSSFFWSHNRSVHNVESDTTGIKIVGILRALFASWRLRIQYMHKSLKLTPKCDCGFLANAECEPITGSGAGPEPPAGSRDKGPGQRVWGNPPTKAENTFWKCNWVTDLSIVSSVAI